MAIVSLCTEPCWNAPDTCIATLQVHINFGEVRWEPIDPIGHVEEVHSFRFSMIFRIAMGCWFFKHQCLEYVWN